MKDAIAIQPLRAGYTETLRVVLPHTSYIPDLFEVLMATGPSQRRLDLYPVEPQSIAGPEDPMFVS